MAITIPTYDAVVAATLAFYRNRFPGRDLSDQSYLGKQARAEAMLFFLLLQSVSAADSDAVPTTKTSSAALDIWAVAVGVPGSTTGLYGRKLATAALGASGTVTGTNGTSYPDGSTLVASDGSTLFKLNNGGSALVIPGSPPGSGSISATFDAITTGAIGNLSANAILTWQNPPSGSDTTVKLTAGPSTLGVDVESDISLLGRIQTKMQSPPKGGTSADFRGWGESVSGVVRAYPYPLRGGLGTLHLLITSTGSGKLRDPGATVATNVSNYINGTATGAGQRTVTAQGYTTLRPYFTTIGLVIRCRMQASKSLYAFDWNDTAATYTVSSYSAGPPATLTLSSPPPSTLIAGVTAALKPRIQIINSNTTAPGWVATPYQIGVTNIVGSVLTLDTVPTNWVIPNNGDAVYAGGPAVASTASAILAYVDGLGPSRSGGYADVNDVWEYTCSIARLTQIAIDSSDTNGTRFFSNTSVASGVTISYNGGASAATDVVASDATANGPELLYCRGIAITQ